MVNIAVLGYGIIGSGVVETIYKRADIIAAQAGDTVNVKYICDLRDFSSSPLRDKFTKDFGAILSDPEVSIVAEMIGGLHPAYDHTKAALEAGKSVVTSNKQVVAAKGDELLRIAAEHGVRYLYEASTGGAIPIIRAINDSLAGTDIEEISGILNGTTNYILTRMEHSDLTLSEALAEAQKLGYAEAKPDADILGLDACRKICILAAAAFGTLIDSDKVECRGIDGITPDDIRSAAAEGRTVKLIARAAKQPDGKIFVSVAPTAVRSDCPLSSVSDVYNAVMVKVKDVGDMMFYGKGAGSLPTASAVVADIIDIVRQPKNSVMDRIWTRDDSVYTAECEDRGDIFLPIK